MERPFFFFLVHFVGETWFWEKPHKADVFHMAGFSGSQLFSWISEPSTETFRKQQKVSSWTDFCKQSIENSLNIASVITIMEGNFYNNLVGGFQPIYKILVKLDHFPNIRMNIKKISNHHLCIFFFLSFYIFFFNETETLNDSLHGFNFVASKVKSVRF